MRNLVMGLAAGRVAVGLAMLADPERAMRGWAGGRAASFGGTQMITRGFGARDLSLGAGTLAALMAGGDARDWVVAGAFSDACDLGATAIAEDIPLSGRVLVLGVAGAAIAVGAAYLANGAHAAHGASALTS
jgi:hypothetical protein